MFGLQRRAGAKAAAKAPKLQLIAATMRGRAFAGSFDVAGVSYEFLFSPAKAVQTTAVPRSLREAGRSAPRKVASTHTSTDGLKDVRVRLTGNLTVVDKRSGVAAVRHSLDNVQATLISAQGGIGAAPPRTKMPADLAPVRPDLPVVESTGALSFCGALYFELSRLNGRTLGIPADMNRVQLNVRLAPLNETERNLQGVYSSIVDAFLVKQVDMRIGGEQLNQLNKLLSSG